TRFALVRLDEPGKGQASPGRRVFAILLDTATGATHEAIVSVTHHEIVSCERVATDAPPFGQAPILTEEYGLVERVLAADDGWRKALARRGITDLERVFTAPLTAGHPATPGEGGMRLMRALAFLRDGP